ncbi:hypothetical protein [Pelagibius sp. Alg239-R121]|uniref:hypothetical protein n=1 Tax=Pelagibius sp. Alg239-R121 TaxID=2993448 RepID=UPI0024A74205|nr:hypothetical protein [Pelagibius sp. Alg239-R121]
MQKYLQIFTSDKRYRHLRLREDPLPETKTYPFIRRQLDESRYLRHDQLAGAVEELIARNRIFVGFLNRLNQERPSSLFTALISIHEDIIAVLQRVDASENSSLETICDLARASGHMCNNSSQIALLKVGGAKMSVAMSALRLETMHEQTT